MAPTEDEIAVDEEVHIKEELDTETESLKQARDPGQPTARQVEDHRRTHVPYRVWCRWCWLGRGRGIQHRRSQGSAIPIIGIDYFFITKGGVKVREELEHSLDEDGEKALNDARTQGDIVKCLLVRCTGTKALFAHVVPCKGADENGLVADMVVRDVAWLGHTRIIVKADNEPAIQSLVTRVLAVARVECKDLEQLTKEDPATYDSKSNGGTEVGVRLIRGLFRTLKLCLESRLDKYIPVDHPLVPWLLEHTALLLNVTVRGTDGLTAWARARGRPFGQQLLGFGESVLYRYPSKGPQSQPDGNMGALGRDGVFLGYDLFANTFIVHNDQGFVASRSVTRRPEQERWQAESLAKVHATPNDHRARSVQKRVVKFGDEAPEQGATADGARLTQLRQLRINISDLKKHEHYDPNCGQCKYIERYGRARPGGAHSEACRASLIEKMRLTEEGRAKLAAHDERTTQVMAEHVEQGAGRQPPAQDKHGEATGHDRHGPTQRGFLERAPDAESADRDPVQPRRHNTAPPSSARVGGPGVAGGSTWEDIPGGHAAPATPRGTPQVVEEDLCGTPQRANEQADPEPNDERMDIEEGANEDESNDVNMQFVGALRVEDALGSLEPTVDDFVSSLLLRQLGSLGRSYRREARQASKAIVSEIYSPPRVTELIKRARMKHVMPGLALDITVNDPLDNQPWDFSLEHKRRRARQLIREQRPYLVIGSPMCKMFSTWQALNAAKSNDTPAIERARTAAVVHLDFVAEIYKDQIDADRYFLHEHPVAASSWSLPSIEALLEMNGVQKVRGDQCQYGAEIRSGQNAGEPINKPTGFMTNSPAVARALSARCQGENGWCSRARGGKHQLCSGRHALEAAKYPRGLCKAILRGVRDQLRDDRLLKDGCYGIQVPDEDDQVQDNLRGPKQGYSGRFKDDLTGQVLKDSLVKEARAAELAYFHTKGVWLKVPRETARARGGRPPISVRWVDVNKGDDMNPKYRSRLVARQLKAMDMSGTSYFAPAPPLEALRTVISMAMTCVGKHQPIWDPESPQRAQVSTVDVARAYFNAKIHPDEPPTFIQLPPEDADADSMCAQLMRHMYGTRPAADGWQEEYSTFLVSLGFRQGEACPNVFHHAAQQIVTSVHGDDFTSSGPADALDWLEHSISEHYEVTIGPRLGPGKKDAKEVRVLNRIIRWCEDRIEYEADPRQVERLISECGLDGANGVATPGVRPTFKKLEEDTELPAHLTTAFRGAAARGNYLAADRIDVQFACKEVCRWMAKPTEHAWEALKRICRYLNRTPRLVYEFTQQSVSHTDVYTDTDWAGCPRTRKSTSGGCVMLGRHVIKHWSSTQQSISLSSGEAEFAGVIRGAGHGLGYQALLKDLGVEVPLRVWTDSSAAIGICTRQGLGKLRHLDTHTLWIQQAVRTKRVDLRKVSGEVNPADLLTKHSLSRQRLESLVSLFSCKYLAGRAESAPSVRKGVSTKATMATASRELGSLAEDEEVEALTPPIMPHLVFSEKELNQRYPGLEAPDDEPLDDFVNEADDKTFQAGLRIAAEIQQQGEQEGRKRRPGTWAREDNRGEQLQQLQGPEQPLQPAGAPPAGSTGSSPLRRRRSASGRCLVKDYSEQEQVQATGKDSEPSECRKRRDFSNFLDSCSTQRE